MKKILVTAFFIIVIAGGFIWFLSNGSSSAANSSSQSKEQDVSATLLSPEPFFDFGNISMSAGKVTHTFKIKNTGQTSVAVTKIYTSCMCTIATLKTANGSFGPFGMPGHASIPAVGASIAPNEEADVEIVFDPAAHGPQGAGKVRRVVYLETGGGGPETALQLSFEAIVTR